MHKEDIEKFTEKYIGLVKEDGFEEKAITLRERCYGELDRHNNSPKEYLNITPKEFADKENYEQQEIVKRYKKDILIEAGKHGYTQAHEDIWQLEHKPDEKVTASQEKMIDMLNNWNGPGGGGGKQNTQGPGPEPPNDGPGQGERYEGKKPDDHDKKGPENAPAQNPEPDPQPQAKKQEQEPTKPEMTREEKRQAFLAQMQRATQKSKTHEKERD
jgi:hypothetical protein